MFSHTPLAAVLLRLVFNTAALRPSPSDRVFQSHQSCLLRLVGGGICGNTIACEVEVTRLSGIVVVRSGGCRTNIRFYLPRPVQLKRHSRHGPV